MKRSLWYALLIIAAALAASAQTIKVPDSWDKLAAKASEVVNVTMDRNMLRFASKFMEKEGDTEGIQLVSKLNGIYVRSLEFKKPGAYTDADVAPIRAQLQGSEWSPMVHVDSKDESGSEKVDIFMKVVNGQTMGMVILAQEPLELTLVHLDGPINPEDLDELSGNFGIPKNVHAPKSKKAAPAPKPAATVKK